MLRDFDWTAKFSRKLVLREVDLTATFGRTNRNAWFGDTRILGQRDTCRKSGRSGRKPRIYSRNWCNIPVVPHKAVAEVSKTGNLQERLVVVNPGWQSESTDGPKGAWGLLSFSSFSLFLWLSTYLPIYLLCIYLSIIYRSISLSLSSNYLSICLSMWDFHQFLLVWVLIQIPYLHLFLSSCSILVYFSHFHLHTIVLRSRILPMMV